MLRLRLLLFSLFIASLANGQSDTLPEFFVWKKNKAITISWNNPYENVTQINIQRSKDSLRNYITFHSCPQPIGTRYNFTDLTAKHDSMYYRIFLLFDDAAYRFTKPKRPKEYQVFSSGNQVTDVVKKDGATEKKENISERNFNTEKEANQKNNSNPSVNEESGNRKGKRKLPDEIHLKTATLDKKWRESTFKFEKVRIKVKETGKKTWKPSNYVYTGDDGNVIIDLPDAIKVKYSLSVGREDGRLLFTISEIKEATMKIDKSYFLTSGWYYFILRENNVIKERNRFLITRDY